MGSFLHSGVQHSTDVLPEWGLVTWVCLFVLALEGLFTCLLTFLDDADV